MRNSAVAAETFGIEGALASLEDIIGSKEATDREEDRRELPSIRRVLERIREREGRSGP